LYGKSKASSALSQARQQRQAGSWAGQLAGGQAGQFNRAGRASGNSLSGEIIAKDDKSLTIKLPDGGSANGQEAGSKIVFLSPSTQISKFAAGDAADLTVGQSVMVNGTANADGSITAQLIQLRPARPEGVASTSTPQQ